MNDPGLPLSLLIVSEDRFLREFLADAARETNLFASILAIDGASAFARTMHEVTVGTHPNVFLLDRHSLGPKADRFAVELRTLPATRRAFIASLLPNEARPIPELDFHDTAPPGTPAHAQVVHWIALRAVAVLQPRRAA